MQLFCVVDSETVPFPVNIRLDATVGDLKDAIKAKRQHDFNDFDAVRLTLFKLPEKTEMDALSDLSVYFRTAPKKGRIHVLVRPPINGK